MFDIFPPSDDMTLVPLLFMMVVYGYVLCKASETISEGSEMLLLLYGPGIIGGLVIPILGAIPDCVVILISGLGQGTTSEIQNQISVGVGTLVGSTVMLLTVPWGVGVYLGRRDFDPLLRCAAVTDKNKPKLTKTSLTENCVTTLHEIPSTAKIMMLSSLGYWIIQIPAFFYHSDPSSAAYHEKPYALVGLISTGLGFVAYCYLQLKSARQSEMVRREQEMMRREAWKKSLDRSLGQDKKQEMVFRQYDKDNSGYIDEAELSAALAHLGLKMGRKDVIELMRAIDVGHSADGDAGKSDGKISLNEFKSAISLWVDVGQSQEELLLAIEHNSRTHMHHRRVASSTGSQRNIVQSDPHAPLLTNTHQYGTLNGDLEQQHDERKDDETADGEDEEDCEEEEEEYWEYTLGQLQVKALFLLLLGTGIVTLFSDPMVEVITHVGERMNVSPFYISFVVTPLASNASEVIAGLIFARKKTNESISLTLATLHGAATMNSTLGLCIFMMLVYFRGLSWSYTAEVLAVVTVLLVVGVNALRRNIFLWQACVVLAMYPFSILIVFFLENVCGLD